MRFRLLFTEQCTARLFSASGSVRQYRACQRCGSVYMCTEKETKVVVGVQAVSWAKTFTRCQVLPLFALVTASSPTYFFISRLTPRPDLQEMEVAETNAKAVRLKKYTRYTFRVAAVHANGETGPYTPAVVVRTEGGRKPSF